MFSHKKKTLIIIIIIIIVPWFQLSRGCRYNMQIIRRVSFQGTPIKQIH